MASQHFSNIHAGANSTQIINTAIGGGPQVNFFNTSLYESFKNVNRLRVPGTCKWFLEHQKFQKWKLSKHDDILWVSADPGCGKSVLARSLVDTGKALIKDNVVLCYFFFKDTGGQDSASTALCAILHQLYQNPAYEHLFQKYAIPAIRSYGENLKNNMLALWTLFKQTVTDTSSGATICIFDALDECEATDRKTLISSLEDFLNTSRRRSEVKFLVTSRPYDAIAYAFAGLARNFPTIHLAGEQESELISEEIEKVMEIDVRRIARDRGFDLSIQEALLEQLRATQNRTYLWLRLVLAEIEREMKKTEKKLLSKISVLPESVYEAYEKILARCDDPKSAVRVFQMILAARRALTVLEIDVALEVEESDCDEELDILGEEKRKDWIRETCGLFVTFYDSRIYLIHQTAKEFLVKTQATVLHPERWEHSIGLRDAHRLLARMSIGFLLLPEVEACKGKPRSQLVNTSYGRNTETNLRTILGWLGEDEKRQYVFFEYAATNWIFHAREGGLTDEKSLSGALSLLQMDPKVEPQWFTLYQSSRSNGEVTALKRFIWFPKSAMDFASDLGLVDVVQYIQTSRDTGSSSLSRQPLSPRTGRQPRRHLPQLSRIANDQHHSIPLLARTTSGQGYAKDETNVSFELADKDWEELLGSMKI